MRERTMARKVTHRVHRSHRHGVRRFALKVSSAFVVAVLAHAIANALLVVASATLHWPSCGSRRAVDVAIERRSIDW
jgi:hypothetical protein